MGEACPNGPQARAPCGGVHALRGSAEGEEGARLGGEDEAPRPREDHGGGGPRTGRRLGAAPEHEKLFARLGRDPRERPLRVSERTVPRRKTGLLLREFKSARGPDCPATLTDLLGAGRTCAHPRNVETRAVRAPPEVLGGEQVEMAGRVEMEPCLSKPPVAPALRVRGDNHDRAFLP